MAAGRPGIYDWTPDGEPYVSDETAKLFIVGDQPSTAEQVRERALNALAEEIGLMLAEEVVAAPMDIDLCLILGGGWPFHLGGITPYLDRRGFPSVCSAADSCPRSSRVRANPPNATTQLGSDKSAREGCSRGSSLPRWPQLRIGRCSAASARPPPVVRAATMGQELLRNSELTHWRLYPGEAQLLGHRAP